jgi:hypothetical protein
MYASFLLRLSMLHSQDQQSAGLVHVALRIEVMVRLELPAS